MPSAARLRNSAGSGCSRPQSSCTCQVRGSLPLLRSRHLCDGEQDSVLQPRLASPSQIRRTLGTLPQSLALCQRHRTTGNLVSRVRTVVLVNNLFKPDRHLGRSKFLMPSGTLLFQPTKKSLQGTWTQTSSDCGMIQFDCERRTAPWLSRTWCFPRQRQGTPLRHDPFHNVVLYKYESFGVVVDFVCMCRCLRPQTHRCVCLMQETSNTTFSSTDTFLYKTVRVWIVGAGCGVKDTSCRLRPTNRERVSSRVRPSDTLNRCGPQPTFL